MKHKIFTLLISITTLYSFSQSVGINSTGTSPDASAMLDVAATDKGVLFPRLTATQRDNISTPANGLVIYNTDCNLLNYYDCQTWRNVGEKFTFPNLGGMGSDDIIYGNTNPSENETNVMYMVPAISGAVSYTWTVPSSATIVSGHNSNKIFVNFSTPGVDYICVEVLDACNSRIQTCIVVDVCPLPQVVGPIAGNATPNENSVGNTYSITSVADANDYTWTVPVGAIISGGQGTNSITVDFPNAIVAEDICVVANSDCGTGNPVCISITTQCPVPVAPIVSAGSNINATDFDANWNPVSGVTSYYLDVATDAGFTSFVAGFQNLSVGNVTTYNITGLICEVDYWYRVRTENACGISGNSGVENVTMGSCWSCNDPITDTRDGNTYGSVLIGNQCWMSENLAYLPSVSGTSSRSNTVAHYYVYGYNGTNVTTAKAQPNYTTYGVLYNWTAALNGVNGSSSNPSGVQGACPAGWHLPSDAEWIQMNNFISSNVGLALKDDVSWDGNNSYGFTALPGGRFDGASFGTEGSSAYFKTATEYNATKGYYRYLSSGNNSLSGGGAALNGDKERAMSIRCVKD